MIRQLRRRHRASAESSNGVDVAISVTKFSGTEALSSVQVAAVGVTQVAAEVEIVTVDMFEEAAIVSGESIELDRVDVVFKTGNDNRGS